MSGIADTTPWENINDPTPRSISLTVSCPREQTAGLTYDGHSECFALGKRARKYTEIDGKNAYRSEQEHVRSVRRQRS